MYLKFLLFRKLNLKKKLIRIREKTHHFVQILKTRRQSLYNVFIEWFIKICSSVWFLLEILIQCSW